MSCPSPCLWWSSCRGTSGYHMEDSPSRSDLRYGLSCIHTHTPFFPLLQFHFSHGFLIISIQGLMNTNWNFKGNLGPPKISVTPTYTQVNTVIKTTENSYKTFILHFLLHLHKHMQEGPFKGTCVCTSAHTQILSHAWLHLTVANGEENCDIALSSHLLSVSLPLSTSPVSSLHNCKRRGRHSHAHQGPTASSPPWEACMNTLFFLSHSPKNLLTYWHT